MIRVGRTVDPKVPDEVRLDEVLNRRSEAAHTKILAAESELNALREERDHFRELLVQWDRLDGMRRDAQELAEKVRLSKFEVGRARADMRHAARRVREAEKRLERARQTILFRRRREEKKAPARRGFVA